MNQRLRKRLLWLVQWVSLLAIALISLWASGQYFEAENYRMSVITGFLATVFVISVYRMTHKALTRMERYSESNRGRPAKLGDAFCVGDAVVVLAVTKETPEGRFAALQDYFGIKLVKLPTGTEVSVGKHYYITEEGRLSDFLKTEKGIDPSSEAVTA
jgi:hypothetical protein